MCVGAEGEAGSNSHGWQRSASMDAVSGGRKWGKTAGFQEPPGETVASRGCCAMRLLQGSPAPLLLMRFQSWFNYINPEGNVAEKRAGKKHKMGRRCSDSGGRLTFP